jgi:hypothetical protein
MTSETLGRWLLSLEEADETLARLTNGASGWKADQASDARGYITVLKAEVKQEWLDALQKELHERDGRVG